MTHSFSMVVTQFMGGAYYSEILVDDVPQRRLVGVERFRTAPVTAEALTDEVRARLKEMARKTAKTSHIRPGDIIWA